MKNIMIIPIFMSTLLFAQNTVEDEESPDVVDDLTPSVMMIQEGEEKMQSRKKMVLEDNENMLEMVNGVMQKKTKKENTQSITKIDMEAEAVENLEPAGIDSL